MVDVKSYLQHNGLAELAENDADIITVHSVEGSEPVHKMEEMKDNWDVNLKTQNESPEKQKMDVVDIGA